MKEKILRILKRHLHSMAGHDWLIGMDETDCDIASNTIDALFASELADYKELCEKQREYYEHLENMLRVHGYNMTGQPLTKSLDFRQRITEIETKIKDNGNR